MAKKKPIHQNAPKPKEFHATPFGVLKGIAVSEAEPVKPTPSPPQKPLESPDNDLELFLHAMSDLRPLNPSVKNKNRSDSKTLHKTTAKTVEELPDMEKTAFIEEIGRLKLETKFGDSAPDEDELHSLGGNRLRQIKRGIISVGYQLDLHGLTRSEALEALPVFLNSAQKKRQQAVLIITGKGNHSSLEPVLNQAVASWLRDAGRTMVLEFTPAPREMGGNGAYLVFLRQLPLSA